MRVLRTFHIPAEGKRVLNIVESAAPDTVIIECGDEAVHLSKETFNAMCDLRYKIEWVPEEETSND